MSKKSSGRRPASAPRRPLEALLADPAGQPLQRALQLQALDQQLRPQLPAALAGHCRLANLRDGQLVFLVDAPVWHARLRLAEADILAAARSFGLQVTRVLVRTMPASTQTDRPDSPPVSAATLDHVREALALLRDESPSRKPPTSPPASGPGAS